MFSLHEYAGHSIDWSIGFWLQTSFFYCQWYVINVLMTLVFQAALESIPPPLSVTIDENRQCIRLKIKASAWKASPTYKTDVLAPAAASLPAAKVQSAPPAPSPPKPTIIVPPPQRNDLDISPVRVSNTDFGKCIFSRPVTNHQRTSLSSLLHVHSFTIYLGLVGEEKSDKVLPARHPSQGQRKISSFRQQDDDAGVGGGGSEETRQTSVCGGGRTVCCFDQTANDSRLLCPTGFTEDTDQSNERTAQRLYLPGIATGHRSIWGDYTVVPCVKPLDNFSLTLSDWVLEENKKYGMNWKATVAWNYCGIISDIEISQ